MISTTLQWLKENILAADVVSVTVSNDQITVITVDSTFIAAIANILEAFNPAPQPLDTGIYYDPDRQAAPTQARSASADARLWGG